MPLFNPLDATSITDEDARAWLSEQPGGDEFLAANPKTFVYRLMSTLSMSQLTRIPGSAERKKLYGKATQ